MQDQRVVSFLNLKKFTRRFTCCVWILENLSFLQEKLENRSIIFTRVQKWLKLEITNYFTKHSKV